MRSILTHGRSDGSTPGFLTPCAPSSSRSAPVASSGPLTTGLFSDTEERYQQMLAEQNRVITMLQNDRLHEKAKLRKAAAALKARETDFEQRVSAFLENRGSFISEAEQQWSSSSSQAGGAVGGLVDPSLMLRETGRSVFRGETLSLGGRSCSPSVVGGRRGPSREVGTQCSFLEELAPTGGQQPRAQAFTFGNGTSFEVEHRKNDDHFRRQEDVCYPPSSPADSSPDEGGAGRDHHLPSPLVQQEDQKHHFPGATSAVLGAAATADHLRQRIDELSAENQQLRSDLDDHVTHRQELERQHLEHAQQQKQEWLQQKDRAELERQTERAELQTQREALRAAQEVRIRELEAECAGLRDADLRREQDHSDKDLRIAELRSEYVVRISVLSPATWERNSFGRVSGDEGGREGARWRQL